MNLSTKHIWVFALLTALLISEGYSIFLAYPYLDAKTELAGYIDRDHIATREFAATPKEKRFDDPQLITSLEILSEQGSEIATVLRSAMVDGDPILTAAYENYPWYARRLVAEVMGLEDTGDRTSAESSAAICGNPPHGWPSLSSLVFMCTGDLRESLVNFNSSQPG